MQIIKKIAKKSCMGVHKLILFFLRVVFKNTTIHKIQLKKHKENLNKKTQETGWNFLQ